MKISKLFHWLYGILMLLPILVFIPNAFYYGFNEQAVAQEKTETTILYYSSNEVNDTDDLIDENYYTFTMPIDTYLLSFNLFIDSYNVIDFNSVEILSVSTEKQTPFITNVGGNRNGVQIFINNSGSNNDYKYNGVIFDFLYRKDTNEYGLNNVIQYISECQRQYLKEYQEVTTNMSITDSMSYAWDSVWQNDLFSWSYESFLAEPFKYIGNVFGLPNDNSIYYCLSYWLDISIIWLCFDLIMYVPLLVHRWIDKGVLE